MNSIWSLVNAGNPSRYALDFDQTVAIRKMLAQYATVRDEALPRAKCKTCLIADNSFVAILGDSAEDELFIEEGLVTLGSQRLIDPENGLVLNFQQFFSGLSTRMNPVELQRFKLDGDQAYDPGKQTVRPCCCGGPADFEDWAKTNTKLYNNCYNFAVKDCWTRGVKNMGGAIPSAWPCDDLAVWEQCLVAAGLKPVADWTVTPKGAASAGWHVALALRTGPSLTDFHFLRLDIDHWSHKWSSKAPQTCDLALQPIPKDDIMAAKLCGYDVKSFFWVPRPLKVK